MAIGGGTLSMSTIAGEYGGSTPHSLSEYYRGGGLVPTHSNTAGIPTSGLIDFEDFQNTSATSPSDMFISGNIGSWYATSGKSANGYAGVNVPNGVMTNFSGGTMGSWIDNSMNINGTARTGTYIVWMLILLGGSSISAFFNASMVGLVSNWSTTQPYSASGTTTVNTSQNNVVQMNGFSRYQGIPVNSTGFPVNHASQSNNGNDIAITFS